MAVGITCLIHLLRLSATPCFDIAPRDTPKAVVTKVNVRDIQSDGSPPHLGGRREGGYTLASYQLFELVDCVFMPSYLRSLRLSRKEEEGAERVRTKGQQEGTEVGEEKYPIEMQARIEHLQSVNAWLTKLCPWDSAGSKLSYFSRFTTD